MTPLIPNADMPTTLAGARKFERDGISTQRENERRRPSATKRPSGSTVSANATLDPRLGHDPRVIPVGGVAKRCADIAIAVTALALLAPLMLITAAFVAVTTGRPVIYGHERVGYRGRAFRCYKFRTMIANADQVLQQHLAKDAAAAREWQETQKLRADPRITRLGRLLRCTSIDELPQLWNVLKGDMSCVGPRPVTAPEVRRYRESAALYLSARPGITGLWQVSGRNALRYETRVLLDAHYVAHWSMTNDFAILLRTIPALMRTNNTA